MFRVFDKRDSSREESAYGPGIGLPPWSLRPRLSLFTPLFSLFISYPCSSRGLQRSLIHCWTL
jgi:hypothetical protein